MKTLNKLIRWHMYLIICISMTVILAGLVLVNLVTEQYREYRDAVVTIQQIESVLEENQQELDEVKETYRQTCVHNAEVVARIIESDEALIYNRNELKKVAASVEVDEIHIFDTAGCLFAGTHPEYYDFTFDSGEQMMFFKPMLEDKTLELVQDITPNTAEGKLMQYSAIWSESGKYIVQVGMEPVHVMKATEKNELSYVFSLFGVEQNINYCAVDAQSGEIIGSTDLETMGLKISEIGIGMSKIQNAANGFYAKMNDEWVFCVFKESGENYIGRLVAANYLYRRLPATIFWLMAGLAIFGVILAQAVAGYMNRHVIMKIDSVNQKLKSIADGNLDERLDVTSNIEFARLSEYINLMVKSLIDNNRKMSYALSKTNMIIGTYEYGERIKEVHYTEYMPEIFSLTDEEMKELAQNPEEFAIAFLGNIKGNPVTDEQGVYQYKGKYIRLEEIINGKRMFGVAVDVTAEVQKRMKIEQERDIDVLTGLYNRRGYDNQMERLFMQPQQLGYSATIMIDADGLKGINDTYGHKKGDIYLKEIGSIIKNFGSRNSVAARLGGDEYALFLYDYERESELLEEVEALKYIQNHSTVCLDEKLTVPLRFSLGYCLTNATADYHQFLNEADVKMYKNKSERKKGQ